MLKKRNTKIFFYLIVLILSAIIFLFFKNKQEFIYDSHTLVNTGENIINVLDQKVESNIEIPIELPKITHIETPIEVKAIYMSSYAASSNSFRKNILAIVDETEINTIVIDIKDATGKIAFLVNDPVLQKEKSAEKRIPDIVEFIQLLHSKNIYVIGRISVFQDPYLIKNHPEIAVKTNTDKNIFWKDKKGISWIDASSTFAWDYVITLAKESHSLGFDEINFDYIRFPTDGNMKDIYYPLSNAKIKKDVLKEFFIYLHDNLKVKDNIIISADLFGMTTTNQDDLNIGQYLEYTLPYFDFVAPMVYPSHFPPNWNGYKNPADKPYEVINYTMKKATERAIAIGESPLKIRPWLQDFNLGAIYNKDMVRAQIKAVYDNNLTSWMLWDPKNIYTKDALEKVVNDQ